jgi:hypothetical protein
MKAERRFMVDHQCDEIYEGFSWTGQQVQKVRTKCVPQFVRKNSLSKKGTATLDANRSKKDAFKN